MLLVLKLTGILATAYLAAALLLTLFQDRLLFPRWATGPEPVLPATAERLTLTVEADVRLVGVYLPADTHPPAGAPLLLAFGGNAWNAADLAIHLRSIFADRDIVAFHYRGYAPSTGSPSARALLGDALVIHDQVRARFAPEEIVAVGVSLGAGPAAHLAAMRPVAGLILVTPFDSLHAMAREHFPWLPTRLLLRHRLEVTGDLVALSAPVAVISAEADTVVPPRRTERVREAAQTLVADHAITGAGHNDLFHREEFRRAMQHALSRIEAGERPE